MVSSRSKSFCERRENPQVYKEKAYDTPDAVPQEGSEGLELFHVARPGNADDKIEEPED